MNIKTLWNLYGRSFPGFRCPFLPQTPALRWLLKIRGWQNAPMEERGLTKEQISCLPFTDLMPSIQKSGHYPIVSMTDGEVEQVGWLEKGGWRIGIRSKGGNYYYYAHLASYSQEWKKGDAIQAGEVLGYMGDSGYGTEGTTGQFPVHLHLGIYLPLGSDQEGSGGARQSLLDAEISGKPKIKLFLLTSFCDRINFQIIEKRGIIS